MNVRQTFLSLLAVLGTAVAVPPPPAKVPSGKPARDLTFFVVSDTHYGLSPAGDRTVPLLVDRMNALPGTDYPAALGGKVGVPRGVLHLGDITNDGKREQWDMFVRDYGLTGKEGRLKWPVYVFHLSGDELTVAERRLDNTWGLTFRKKLDPLAAKKNPVTTQPGIPQP